ncbi:MAG: hypothetical protein DRP13_03595 [Candidatus Aenigmatarchaeota archaeon]|nr:MAG: hypothetical protein DRP16_05780 [Candidatus Aenigmarchaeota archaeon]RLJ05808.1 MAG: hypothetical protein DRP18_02290 [Candidatus Aenigmarchaeota archaeon]RLJ07627.1 MAG: hypothetical protein DRP13_03595 [Candidatus Aenigmarchaeota archaeon]
MSQISKIENILKNKGIVKKCSICGKYWTDDPSEAVDYNMPEWVEKNGLISHGYCKKCYEKVKRELREQDF